jgi:hypothetical protein
MRGRLIQKFTAEIARLDTESTESSGYYDDTFRELVHSDAASGDGIGTKQRQEHTVVKLPCQVSDDTWEALQARDQGNTPQSEVVLWFHFRDLENNSLVAADGTSLINVGDRLVTIRDHLTDDVVHTVRTPPGLYVKEARPRGFGICMARPKRNLLRVAFEERSPV